MMHLSVMCFGGTSFFIGLGNSMYKMNKKRFAQFAHHLEGFTQRIITQRLFYDPTFSCIGTTIFSKL